MIGNIDGNSGDGGDGYGRGNGLYAPNVMNAIDLKWYTYVIDCMIENIDGNSGDDGDGYGRGNGLYAPNVATSIASACQQQGLRRRRQLLQRSALLSEDMSTAALRWRRWYRWR